MHAHVYTYTYTHWCVCTRTPLWYIFTRLFLHILVFVQSHPYVRVYRCTCVLHRWMFGYLFFCGSLYVHKLTFNTFVYLCIARIHRVSNAHVASTLSTTMRLWCVCVHVRVHASCESSKRMSKLLHLFTPIERKPNDFGIFPYHIGQVLSCNIGHFRTRLPKSARVHYVHTHTKFHTYVWIVYVCVSYFQPRQVMYGLICMLMNICVFSCFCRLCECVHVCVHICPCA